MQPAGEWFVGAGDALAAFLQGERAERPNDLFMLVPRGPLAEAAATLPRDLDRIWGSVYGGADGPYLWRCHAREVLIGQPKFQAPRTDEALFVYYERPKGTCIIGFHVDDALMTCLAAVPRQHFPECLIAFSRRPWRWPRKGAAEIAGLEPNRFAPGAEKGASKATRAKYAEETPGKN